MSRWLFVLSWTLLAPACFPATTNITPWTPLFRGVEHSSARVLPTQSGELYQALNCLRIDLHDPEVALFSTPHCTNNCAGETLAENTSRFLESNRLQVAINCNFYESSSGPNDQPLGQPYNVEGLAMTQGQVVSPQINEPQRVAMLFTTNNVATFIPRNWPATNTEGIFTAIGGNILLLTNGMNAGTNVVSDLDPRTAIGLSRDNRYLYLMTADGRQGSRFGLTWADGMNFYETADWLARFGAYHGMNVDGGGSTTMCMADCAGKSVRLNRPSFLLTTSPPRERNVGHNFGVYARPAPAPMDELVVTPGLTTALLTWQTDFAGTTQVEYGPTTAYGSVTPLDERPLKAHVATLTGLRSGSNYFFRAISYDGPTEYSLECRFATTTSVARTLAFDVTKTWKFTTNNLDGTLWKTPGYDDGDWGGPGRGLLYIENNASVSPKNTLLPPGVSPVMRSYYFRTHFDFSGSSQGVSLVFSNYVDDGAVFYLNGAELFRLRMPATPTLIQNNTAATGQPGGTSGGDATPATVDVIPVTGNLVNNLVQGDNVLAVEVHNLGSSGDIVFGSALYIDRPGVTVPRLFIAMEGDLATLYWNGEGFTLQQSMNLESTDSWTDVPGPVTTSPALLTNAGTRFYRLRQ